MMLYEEKICYLQDQKAVLLSVKNNFLTYKNYVGLITEYVII